MATCLFEIEYEISNQLKKLANIVPPNQCEIDFLRNGESSNCFQPLVKTFNVCSYFTAKREGASEILNYLQTAAKFFEIYIAPKLREMGYSIKITPITMSQISDSFEDYTQECECGFCACFAEVSITEKNFKILARKVKEDLNTRKANPSYYEGAVYSDARYCSQYKYNLDFKKLTVNGISAEQGTEKYSEVFKTLKHWESFFAAGILPKTVYKNDYNFIKCVEPLSYRIKTLTNINGDISFNGKIHKFYINCIDAYPHIDIVDVNGKVIAADLFKNRKINDQFFAYKTKAKMKQLISSLLIKGAKITAFEVHVASNKTTCSPYSKFNEITFITSSYYSSQGLIFKLTKKGEFTVTDLLGVEDNKSLNLYKEKIGDMNDLIKNVFCANKEFAYIYLAYRLQISIERINKIFF